RDDHGKPIATATPLCIIQIEGLEPGQYQLKANGETLITASDKEWQRGVPVDRGPDFDQAERLRQVILRKNQLYFDRWRPQNETSLFGFRKHEQGQNAREIPMFDPLIEKEETQIAKLRAPVKNSFELVRGHDPSPARASASI